MTVAGSVCKRRFRRLPAEVRAHAESVLAFAVRHESYAYRFVELKDESLLEVRAWPNGDVKLTEVDKAGTPVDRPAAPKVRYLRG